MIQEKLKQFDKWIELHNQYWELYKECDGGIIAIGQTEQEIHVRDIELLYLPGALAINKRACTKYNHEISKVYNGMKFFAVVDDDGLERYKAKEQARDLFMPEEDKQLLTKMAEELEVLPDSHDPLGGIVWRAPS